MTNEELRQLPYKVGPLLYTPAINVGIADKLEKGAYPFITSMAFCLEDSIRDEALEQAEIDLHMTLKAIKGKRIPKDKCPLLFVRVRTPEHMNRVHSMLADVSDVLMGYILPKFDLTNCSEYTEQIIQMNVGRVDPLFMMPILESKMIADIGERYGILQAIKTVLDNVKQYVLNVRVGGNDFSKLYGLRRSVNQNIYEVGVIRDILVDIINIFASDFVVSAPVWEYFGEDPSASWANGLRKELELDQLNGFIGKTAIHLSQLPIIYESMKASRDDYEDALRILNWKPKNYAVAKSSNGSRMNEVKCHTKWAMRVYTLGQIYGVREE